MATLGTYFLDGTTLETSTIVFTDAALTILTEAFTDVDYAFEATSILPEFYIPFFWIVILWMTSTIVRSLKDRTTQGNTYWGI